MSLDVITPHLIATPALDLIDLEPREGAVIVRSRGAIHVDLGSGVIAITARGAPLMPNGISLPGRLDRPGWPQAGHRVAFEPGTIRAGTHWIRWDSSDPPVWNPRVPDLNAAGRNAIGDRAGTILRSCRHTLSSAGAQPGTPAAQLATALFQSGDEGAEDGVRALVSALRTRKPDHAAKAADLLIGRGAGLTPVADDLVAGAASALIALRGSPALDWDVLRAWLRAVVPDDIGDRTGAVSAALLKLAARGQVMDPVRTVLDPRVGSRHLGGCLQRLHSVGHNTGTAYAVAICMAIAEVTADSRIPYTTKERVI